MAAALAGPRSRVFFLAWYPVCLERCALLELRDEMECMHATKRWFRSKSRTPRFRRLASSRVRTRAV